MFRLEIIVIKSLAVLILGLHLTPTSLWASNDNQLSTGKEGLTGTVVADGQAVSGAAVIVRLINSAAVARSTTTNEQGRFELTNLETGLYSVTAIVPGYVMRRPEPNTPVPLYRVGDSVSLELIKGGVITGTVTNANNEPVVAVPVRAIMVRDEMGRQIKSLPTVGQSATDDRGVYRIFGLVPGTYIVEVGSRGSTISSTFTPFDMDAPTFGPSSSRDNAAPVVVSAGQEATMDVRYRAEPGHIISGTIKNLGSARGSIALTLAENGWMPIATSFQTAGTNGFGFYGIPDGVYDVVAQEYVQAPGNEFGELLLSEPKRVEVKGTDVTGVELITKPLARISGKIALQPSTAPECAEKRRPILSEISVTIQRNRKDTESEPAAFLRPVTALSSPDKDGNLVWRNLVAGQYMLVPRFYARYWFLQSITMTTLGAPSAKSNITNVKSDAAGNWTTIKSGDRISGLTITLAEGAASVRGRISAPEGVNVPANLNVFLVPAERENAEDVVKYFGANVTGNQTFAFDNVPPGHYWVLAQASADKSATSLRSPAASELRQKLRLAAQLTKIEMELKPCQNVVNYSLNFTP